MQPLVLTVALLVLFGGVRWVVWGVCLVDMLVCGAVQLLGVLRMALQGIGFQVLPQRNP